MTTVFFVVPEGVDDPARPSGGNIYDRRISRGLGFLGWTVIERQVPGCWPRPDTTALDLLAQELSTVPDESVVMFDGLIASAAGEIIVPAARRLRVVVLVHMLLGTTGGANVRLGEAAVLRAAGAVITTSGWTRDQVQARYDLGAESVHIAEPGVDPESPAIGTAGGGRLVCVAAVLPHKGHDLLLAALAEIAECDWQCTCVGALDRDPGFVEKLRRTVAEHRLGDRVHFVGPRTGADLHRLYAASDLLLLASHAETYAMVVTEALARGIPVIATEVGGVPDALGFAPDGRRPGLLVPPGDVDALAAALRQWLVDPGLRQRLRKAAVRRGELLTDWSVTSQRISRVLAGVAG